MRLQIENFSSEPESQPRSHNPLGAKGCGEAGAIAALAALLSTVLAALRPLFTDMEMPITPARLWSAIAAAAGGGGDRFFRPPQRGKCSACQSASRSGLIFPSTTNTPGAPSRTQARSGSRSRNVLTVAARAP